MDQFSSPTGLDMAPGGLHGMARFGDDRNLLVLFFNKAVDVPIESAKKGRPIKKDQIFVKIQHPGEVLNIIERPASEQDKFRFRQQWSNFVQNRSQVPEGTPIDQLFPNHPSVGENLRAYGVYTIEQCAVLSAQAIDTIGRGAQEYVNRAQRYLASADKGAAFTQLQSQLEQKDQQISTLENQVKQLKEQMDHFMMKFNDPIRGAESPPFVVNHDVQAERINANHITKDMTKNRRGKTKSYAPPQTLEDKLTDPLSAMENNNDIMATEGQDGH